jgi:hypothetical protein
MEKFVIDLNPSKDKIETYEESDKNLLKIRIQLPTGEMVEGEGYRVEIALSNDAMLALGTSLIRAAHSKNKELNFWHLHPSDKDLISQNFGVYLHPKSCELLISEKDFESIHKIVASSDMNP